MNSQTADGKYLDDDGQEILFPIASDVNGKILEADQGLRRFLIGMRDAIAHDDQHFKEETFADVFAFYETAVIAQDTAKGEGHHFDDAEHAAMSVFSMVSVGAAFYLLNSFSEQRGKKQVEFRRSLKMYTEFEDDRHNEDLGETREKRREAAMEKLAGKMKHSGLQFVKLPVKDKRFPHTEFQQMAKDRGIGQPVLMSTINTVRNFVTSQDHRIEMGTNAAGVLAFRTSQLGRAIKNAHQKARSKIEQYAGQSGNAAAVPIAVGMDAVDRFGKLVNPKSQADDSTEGHGQPKPSLLNRAENAADNAVNQTFDALDEGISIGRQYALNAVHAREIPSLFAEGFKETRALGKGLKGKAQLKADPDIIGLNLFRAVAGQQALPEDLEERLGQMNEGELDALKENTLEILKDIEGHTKGAKRAKASFLVQATFAGAQIAVGSLKVAKMFQDQHFDKTVGFNIYSFFASIGPLRGFKDELKSERALIDSKEAHIAESLVSRFQITDEEIAELPDEPEEPMFEDDHAEDDTSLERPEA